MKLCRNAFAGETAWFCYDFGGRKTKGKEALNEDERCEVCAMAVAGTDNPPSWMSNENEE